MRSQVLQRVAAAVLLACATVTLSQSQASAATTSATRDPAAVSAAIADPLGSTLTGSSLPVIPPLRQTQCANGVDDDEDGFVDLVAPTGETADPDCTSASDNLEQSDNPSACANGIDDDGDGFTDFIAPDGADPDPGCTSATDHNEIEGEPDPTPICANGIDDDFDGYVDFSPPAGEQADAGCTNATDIDEGSEGIPPVASPTPVAVVSSPLAGFPTSGSSFGILSSGDALLADDANDTSGSGADNEGGGGGHGTSFYDLVTLKLDISVPLAANCLALDFRFLSEEFPEYVGSSVNDGFVAELDTSDFTAVEANNNEVVAPRNFAFDESGKAISINTAGFAEGAAAGTTYDGATPLLRALTPVTPGAHSVFLSVFDQGDSILDSAVFIDNVRVFTVPAASCQSGATDDLTPPDTTITAGPSGTTADSTPTFSFTATEAGSTFQCRVDGGAWSSCTSPHTTASLTNGAHTFEVRAIDGAGNVDASPASRAFTVETTPPDTTPPDTTITAGPRAQPPTARRRSRSPLPRRARRSSVVSTAAPGVVHLTAHHRLVDQRCAHLRGAGDRRCGQCGCVTGQPGLHRGDDPTGHDDHGWASGTTADSTPTFSFTATEAGSTFQCRVDGGAWSSCTSPHTTASLTNGAHTFEVRAIDGAGNVDASPASRAFTVETTPPPPSPPSTPLPRCVGATRQS